MKQYSAIRETTLYLYTGTLENY